MESGQIRDNQIIAYRYGESDEERSNESCEIGEDSDEESYKKSNEYKARLNNPSGDYWSAGCGSSYITVDLRNAMYVTKVATQVQEVDGKHSIRFRVEHKMRPSDNWEPIRGGDGHIYVSEQNVYV